MDGKPAVERVPCSNKLDIREHVDRDQMHCQLQDVLPFEAPSPPDSKVGSGSLAKDSDNKPSGLHEKAKESSNPTEHDERGNARKVGQSFSRRADERDWRRDSRNQKHEEASEKKESNDTRQRDENSQAMGDDKNAWNHDGFYKLEADPLPPSQKRRAFREEKIPLDSEYAAKAAVEPAKASHSDRPPFGSERRDDRGCNSYRSERYEKPPTRDRLANWGESQRVGLPPRERYSGGSGSGRGDYRGRNRYDGRQEFHSGGAQGDKWKHDLFQEANRSPTPKDEEDRIAKLEALLA